MNANRYTALTSEVAASTRKFAIAAGVCYLITHVTSVAAPFLYGPVLNNSGYITGSSADTGVIVGAIFDVICAMGIVGTAVALFPVVKRQNEGIALGYVGLRTLEAGIIAVGALSILTAVTLRQMGASSDPATLASLGTLCSALAGAYKWTAMLGPGLVCGVNTVLMAYLMYRSRLVPRFIPVLGLTGGPLVFAYNTAMMFGLADQIQAWAAILVIPIFAWEVSLAVRLIVKGFAPAALSAMSSRSTASAAASTSPNELLGMA